MKRRDIVRALLTPEPTADPGSAISEDRPHTGQPHATASHTGQPGTGQPGTGQSGGLSASRVPALRSMGLQIGRLAEAAAEAAALRRQLADAEAVVTLDPGLVDPSFAVDRLAPTDDPEYRRLVQSLRASGQIVPVLVRPHPDRLGRYQIAYGHRRRAAAIELGIGLRAIVRPLGDAALVVAQGKENAERRNLSFIERALFAAHLAAAGFDRATLNAALAVHTAETTRLLAVAAAVPADMVRAIGPAPKAGRPRWLELAGLLARPGAAAAAARKLAEPAIAALPSDRRFDAVLAALRAAVAAPWTEAGSDAGSDAGSGPGRTQAADTSPLLGLDLGPLEVIRNAAGAAVVRVTRSGSQLRLTIDLRRAPEMAALLLRDLPELVRSCDTAAVQGGG